MTFMEDERKSEGPRRVQTAGHEHPTAGAIGNQLRAIGALSKAFEQHLGRTLAVNDTDLEAMEHLILSGPMTPSELAPKLGISNAATTFSVDRLVASGHARREPHPTDRRKTVIVPSPPSVARAFDALMPVLNGVADAAADLPAEHRDIVGAFLASVIDVYEGALEVGAAEADTPA